MSCPPEGQADTAEGHERASVVVGLLTDPDLPDVVAQRLAEVLAESLSQRISDRVSWTVETRCDPFGAGMDQGHRLLDKARQRVQGTDWDIAVCITDLPLRIGHGSFIADISLQDRVALLSLPTLGGLWLTRRAHDMVVTLVDELTAGLPAAITRTEPPPDLTRSVTGNISYRAAPSDTDVDIELVTSRGVTRLLAGLVRANRPWQLTLGLSTALAGAATGSAFGILYTTIWSLGASMQWWRLAGVTLAALVTFVAWLIVGHRLWERRSPSPHFTRVINASTVLTVMSGVALFYTALLSVNVLAAALLIPPEHLGQVLGRPIGLGDYLRVALMASAMGVIAGAVGSGLEKDETVRAAAYNQREQQRWARATD